MGSTWPNPTHVGWVGLGWTYVMGWVGLNFFWPTMVGWVKKFPQPDPTPPMHTPTTQDPPSDVGIKKSNTKSDMSRILLFLLSKGPIFQDFTIALFFPSN